MRIGYLRAEAIKPLDLFQDWRVVARNELGELVRATHAIAIGKVDSVAEQLNTQMSALEPFVDEVVASIDSSRELAWESFISGVPEGSKVLLESFDQLSPYPAKQLEFIRAAKDRGILILPMDQKELLDLTIDAAFSLLSKYSLTAMESMHDPRNEKDSYERMLTLMKQGKSVVEIIEETGWSRSTLFRLRREFKEKLATDLPSFKKRYE